MKTSPFSLLPRRMLRIALKLGLACALPALAGQVQLATMPLANSTTSTVQPNLMLMLDDSGSMDWDYMPDEAKNFDTKYGYYSSQCNGTYFDPTITYEVPVNSAGTPYAASNFTAAWRNGYNHTEGTVDLSSAYTGGSGTGNSGTNLPGQAAFYYTYSGTQTTEAQKDYFNTSSTFYRECNSNIGSTPGSGVFTKVTLTAASAQAQNFANWYSYHSTRMLMMKTAVGRAFKNLNSSFRVGFMTLNNNNSPDFVNIAPFTNNLANTAGQKFDWYSKLYAAAPGNRTPLREALSKVGNLYANKYSPQTVYTSTIAVGGSGSTSVSSITVNSINIMAAASTADTSTSKVATNVAGAINAVDPSSYSAVRSGSNIIITGTAADLGRTPVVTKSGSMTFTVGAFTATTTTPQLNGVVPNDPIQYSCQKNFVILSTDGYWNGNAGYKLDGTSAIGNQDHSAPRPMYDGAPLAQVTSRVQKTETQVAQTTSQQTQRTQQTQARTSNLQTQTSQLQTRTGDLQSQTSQLQTRTSSLQSQTSQLQTRTSSLQSQTSQLQVSTGQLQKRTSSNSGSSWSSWSNTGSCTWDNTGSSRTQCGYGTMSAWINATGTCTVVDQSADTAHGTTWTGNKTACQYTAWSGWANAGSCNVATKSTGPTSYSVLTARNCQYTSWNGWTGTSSCTAATQSAGPTNYTVGTARECQTVVTLAYANASSCTATTTPNGSGNTTQCRYWDTTANATWSAWAGTSSCTAVAQSAGPTNYTVGTARNCQTIVTSPYANAASCTVTPPNASGDSTQCQYNWSAWAGTPSCTAVNPSTGPTSYTVSSARECQTAITSPYANVTSCTPTTIDASGNTTQCQYTLYSAWTGVNTCTAQAQSTSAPYAGPAVECQDIDTTVAVSSCSAQSPSGTNGYATVSCATVTIGGPAYYVDSCTSVAATAGNNWTTTSCTPSTVSGPTYVASCTAGLDAITHITTICNTTTTGPTPVSSCTPQAASFSNNYTTISCVGDATGGTLDTLADTAMYYYQNDLRDVSLNNCTGAMGAGVDVCNNDVFTSGIDTNRAQHLTTFTLGLGARGRMVYSSTYLTDTSGDFPAVKNGSTASSTVCTWQASGACNWPVPSSGAIENIDDLWHAAVDGRGKYFSAGNSATLATGLASALRDINQVTGAASAAATSTLNPTAENNFAYVASYTTIKWSGNLEQRTINVNPASTDPLGTVSSTASWCVENIAASTCATPRVLVPDTSGAGTVYYCSDAAADINAPSGIDAADCVSPSVYVPGTTPTCRLPADQIANTCSGTLPAMIAATTDTRTIYSVNSGALANFDHATFGSAVTAGISGLSQWGSFTTAQQTAATNNLVNYLRGQQGYENDRTSNAVANWLFRYRDAVMGDALESQPTYAKAPPFNYVDAGYTGFKSAHASRGATVFLGTNDGMLHAFNAANGVERWAFIPSAVLPNLWRLADVNYDTHHTNFVNGSPTVSDVCTSACGTASAVWKTILVAGLNAGGREYYALDITDENAPSLLWEFTSNNSSDLGYTYSVPIVTKKQDGTWVVLITSGYDNGTKSQDNTTDNNPTGDGEGHLFVLSAADGSIISDISTGAGSPAAPSGLAKISGYATQTATNQAGYIYGGDLQGNLWRFDINSSTPAVIGTGSAFQLAALKDGSGTAQPITATPTLGKINGKRVIFVGTGKYLETGDLTTTQTQTVYAIKDDDVLSPLGNPRSTMVSQTFGAASGTARTTSSSNSVNFNTQRGWYVDLPISGERVYQEAKLIQGILIVPSIIPSNTVCSSGGTSWQNYFDYKSGSAESVEVPGIIVGVNDIYIDNKAIILTVTNADPTPRRFEQPTFPESTGEFKNQRQIWREWTPE
jgi:Tfp pilus tip-associated adhesin PilY1